LRCLGFRGEENRGKVIRLDEAAACATADDRRAGGLATAFDSAANKKISRSAKPTLRYAHIPGVKGADVWPKINGQAVAGHAGHQLQVDQMSCRHYFRSVVKMIAAPKMAVRRSCDVTVGSYLVGDTVSGDRSIRKQLALSDRA